MKKCLFFCAVLAFSLLGNASAMADTNVFFSVRGPHHHKVHYRKPHHRTVERLYVNPLLFALSYSLKPSPYVVHETKVVQPVILTAAQESTLQAIPASDVYVTQTGQTCREYQTVGKVAGEMQSLYGKACLQPDGSWRIVE